MGHRMVVSWGKPVPLPATPIYGNEGASRCSARTATRWLTGILLGGRVGSGPRSGESRDARNGGRAAALWRTADPAHPYVLGLFHRYGDGHGAHWASGHHRFRTRSAAQALSRTSRSPLAWLRHRYVARFNHAFRRYG